MKLNKQSSEIKTVFLRSNRSQIFLKIGVSYEYCETFKKIFFCRTLPVAPSAKAVLDNESF